MKRIELLFYNEDGKTATISLENPVEPVDAAKVNEVMDEIIEQNVFYTSGGALVKKRGARIVERNVTEIEIELED